jgi:hypothetical protein
LPQILDNNISVINTSRYFTRNGASALNNVIHKLFLVLNNSCYIASSVSTGHHFLQATEVWVTAPLTNFQVLKIKEVALFTPF